MHICQYCGARRRDDPVLECWLNGERYFLHRGCQDDWRKLMDNLPANSKVLGKAPGGHRCELCGKGSHVFRIKLPGERKKQRRDTSTARDSIGGRRERFAPTAVLYGTRGAMTTTVISVPRTGSDLNVKSLSSAAIGANVAGEKASSRKMSSCFAPNAIGEPMKRALRRAVLSATSPKKEIMQRPVESSSNVRWATTLGGGAKGKAAPAKVNGKPRAVRGRPNKLDLSSSDGAFRAFTPGRDPRRLRVCAIELQTKQ